MARFAGFGLRQKSQALIDIKVFPLRRQSFTFSSHGLEQKFDAGSGNGVVVAALGIDEALVLPSLR